MLAYLDSRSGPVPCRVLSIDLRKEGHNVPSIRVQYTATRGPWLRGEVSNWTPSNVIPRHALRPGTKATGGKYRVWAYDWRDVAKRQGFPIDGGSPPQLDARYATAREASGNPAHPWVSRFCGEWLGSAATREEALGIARKHRAAFLVTVAG